MIDFGEPDTEDRIRVRYAARRQRTDSTIAQLEASIASTAVRLAREEARRDPLFTADMRRSIADDQSRLAVERLLLAALPDAEAAEIRDTAPIRAEWEAAKRAEAVEHRKHREPEIKRVMSELRRAEPWTWSMGRKEWQVVERASRDALIDPALRAQAASMIEEGNAAAYAHSLAAGFIRPSHDTEPGEHR